MMKIISAPLKASLFLALMVLCSLAGCDNDADKVPGSWHSLSVTSKSPFFRNALADYREGDIRLELGPGNKFSWDDSREGTRLKGTFEANAREIKLVLDGGGETVRVRYSYGRKKLVIKTDDTFSFTFLKDNKQ